MSEVKSAGEAAYNVYLSGTNVPLQENGPLCRDLWERTAQAAIDFYLSQFTDDEQFNPKLIALRERAERAEVKAANLAAGVEKMSIELMSLNSKLEQEQSNHAATKALIEDIAISVQTPWIACSERMPTKEDETQDVWRLVLWTNGRFRHMANHNPTRIDADSDIGSDESSIAFTPTHWMAIPPVLVKSDPVREEFEAWAKAAGYNVDTVLNSDVYINPPTGSAWEAWRAAKKGVQP